MNTADDDRLKKEAVRRAHALRREAFDALWVRLAALLRAALPRIPALRRLG